MCISGFVAVSPLWFHYEVFVAPGTSSCLPGFTVPQYLSHNEVYTVLDTVTCAARNVGRYTEKSRTEVADDTGAGDTGAHEYQIGTPTRPIGRNANLVLSEYHRRLEWALPSAERSRSTAMPFWVRMRVTRLRVAIKLHVFIPKCVSLFTPSGGESYIHKPQLM